MIKGYFDESNQEWIIPIKDKTGKLLDLKKDKIHKARDKTNPNKINNFRIKRIVWRQQSGRHEKVNFIAEILWSDGNVSCWLCYYIFNRYGKWAFGQYGPMIPITDFKELYEYACEKGIL